MLEGLGIRMRSREIGCMPGPSHQGRLSAQVVVLDALRRRGGERRGEASRQQARAHDHLLVHRSQAPSGFSVKRIPDSPEGSWERVAVHPIRGADLQRPSLARLRGGWRSSILCQPGVGANHQPRAGARFRASRPALGPNPTQGRTSGRAAASRVGALFPEHGAMTVAPAKYSKSGSPSAVHGPAPIFLRG